MNACCGNPKIANVQAKCSDKFSLTMKNLKYTGYVPRDIGLGDGEYVKFEICLKCGKIQEFHSPDLEEFIADNEEKRICL
jgi:hypothetical protein